MKDSSFLKRAIVPIIALMVIVVVVIVAVIRSVKPADVSEPTEKPTVTTAPASETKSPSPTDEVIISNPTVSPSEEPAGTFVPEPTEQATENPVPVETALADPTEGPTVVSSEKPATNPTAKPTEVPTAKPTAAPTAKPAVTAKPTAVPTTKPTAKPVVTVKPTEKPVPTQAPVSDAKYTEKNNNGVIERTNIEYTGLPEGTNITTKVDVGGSESIDVHMDDRGVKAINYTVSESVRKYLTEQEVSNAMSHIYPELLKVLSADDSLKGTPFYYSIGRCSLYNLTKVIIDEQDKNNDGILAIAYARTDDNNVLVKYDPSYYGSESPVAIYLNANHGTGSAIKSILHEDAFILRTEIHNGIKVTRPVEDTYSGSSDYLFMAYPLTNGKFVINCGGGQIVLNRAPASSIDIRFDAGPAGGFYKFQLAVDGKVIYECEDFCLNSIAGHTQVFNYKK